MYIYVILKNVIAREVGGRERQTHTHTPTNARKHSLSHSHTHTCKHTLAHAHTNIAYVYRHIYTHTCTHTRTLHTYTHTLTHTHTHTHTHTPSPSLSLPTHSRSLPHTHKQRAGRAEQAAMINLAYTHHHITQSNGTWRACVDYLSSNTLSHTHQRIHSMPLPPLPDTSQPSLPIIWCCRAQATCCL